MVSISEKLDSRYVSEEGRLYLRLMTVNDVSDRYVAWFADEDFTHFLDAKRITKQDAIEHLLQGQASNAWVMLAIVDAETDLHIGNIKLGPISWRHGLSDMSTIIGDKAYWGKGYATEAIKVGIKIAFDIIGLRKLSAGIADQNVGSLKCYTAAGWVVEGRLKGQHLIAGMPQDRICVGCFNPKFFN